MRKKTDSVREPSQTSAPRTKRPPRPKSRKPHQVNGKRVKLTDKEYRLLVELRRGATKKEAALKAGYSSKYPTESAIQALKGIQGKVGFDIWEAAGFTFNEFISSHLVPAMHAKKKVFAVSEGKFSDERIVDDNQAQHQSRRLFAEIAGILKTEQENTGASFKVVVINGAHRPPRIANPVTIPAAFADDEIPALTEEKV